MYTPEKLEELGQVIREDLLGKIPLFFSKLEIKDESTPDDNPFVKRYVKVDAYQTNEHGKKPYYKSISKFI